jgi:hypothetical protein
LVISSPSIEAPVGVMITFRAKSEAQLGGTGMATSAALTAPGVDQVALAIVAATITTSTAVRAHAISPVRVSMERV